MVHCLIMKYLIYASVLLNRPLPLVFRILRFTARAAFRDLALCVVLIPGYSRNPFVPF